MSAADEADVFEVLALGVAREERAPLASLARGEGLEREDALDCVHGAFCTFLQIALRGELPENAAAFGSFLAGIVRNTARNRRRRHHLARVHREIDATPYLTAAATTSPPEELVARAEECSGN